MTNYGEVHEVWFDGANGEGPNGKKQEYDWTAILSTIRRLQPRAVTAIMGDDVRWVGNERGLGRETEWSATVLTPGTYARCEEQNKALGVKATSKDLGGRDMLVIDPSGMVLSSAGRQSGEEPQAPDRYLFQICGLQLSVVAQYSS